KKLCRADVRAASPFIGRVQIGGESTFVIVRREFASVNFATLVIERRKDERLTELAFIENRVRTFVKTIDAHIETLSNFLRCARIEIMRALRFHDGVLGDCGFVSRAGELRDRALIDVLQRWRCEISCVTGVQRRALERLPNYVDPRTELVLMRERVHDVESTAEIDCQLFKGFP